MQGGGHQSYFVLPLLVPSSDPASAVTVIVLLFSECHVISNAVEFHNLYIDTVMNTGENLCANHSIDVKIKGPYNAGCRWLTSIMPPQTPAYQR